MKTSPTGRIEILGHEGFVPGPYLDSVGVWTCYGGHTAAAGAPDPAKMPRGMPGDLNSAIRDGLDLFAKDIAKYEARVNDALSEAAVSQHQFDALVSFDYNTGGIYRAKLTKAIRAGDLSGDDFMGWTKPASIIPRREAEQQLFRDGVYSSARKGVPVWAVDKNGRVDFRRPHKTLTQRELLALMGEGGAGAASGPSLIELILKLIKAIFGGKS